jgi:unsaturated rhamnogalacturonyl hydrolase
MKKLLSFCVLFIILFGSVQAQQHSYAQDLAQTAMKIWPDSFALRGPARWSYDQGVILKGVEGIWNATGDPKWFNYIQKSMDFFVQEDGTIKGYRPDEYNIDHINNGKLVLLLYRVTGKEKYKKAADLLRNQLRSHPRTSEGGFWHKKIYPYQMWLDGLYMGQPFYAEYAATFHEDSAFNDITRQFVLMEKHSRDAKTGLLYHGWDESRQQKWADKTTGRSPNVWGRALGWFGMAMVDVLDHIPTGHPGRDSIIRILNRFAKAVISVQDPVTGLWYDVPSMPRQPKNYLEASASSMLVYTLAKGVRNGYLPPAYRNQARKGYEGLVKQFIKTEDGQVNLHGTVSVSGLGGNPYRDGSFEYYMSEKVIVNDPKGMGAFIKAANEMELMPNLSIGQNKRVLLDYYYNNEWRKDPTGTSIRFHYTWDDKMNSGFAMLGDLFRNHGATIGYLAAKPTAANLKTANVYIIVDPDTEKETDRPNFMNESDATVIANWVRDGGVLLLMGNDAGNAELKNFNRLTSRFGIKMNEDNYNLVLNNQYEQGLVTVAEGNPVFPKARRLFIKELATLDIKSPAISVLQKEGKQVAAMAKYGKGTVFVIGDPWLYNEYIDGRKLTPGFDNHQAATDLVRWLLGQSKKK